MQRGLPFCALLLAAACSRSDAGAEIRAAFHVERAGRPPDPVIESIVLTGETATVRAKAMRDGVRVAADAVVARVKGAWRVTAEEWKPEPEDLPGPFPDSIPPAVRAIIDRIASSGEMDGSKAWLELGARYQDPKVFLAEVKPALWDPRPVRFRMSEESMKGEDRTFRYFTVTTGKSKGVRVPARTVGESLRYHLWQLEDAGATFKGPFADWWATYAKPRGLP